VTAVGDTVVETPEREHELAELVPATDAERVENAAVQGWVRRPTVAASMARTMEAAATVPTSPDGSQRRAYGKTLLALRRLDAEDEGLEEVTDWILSRINGRGSLPGSRAVCRQAGKVCRANSYAIRNDEWLGAKSQGPDWYCQFTCHNLKEVATHVRV
jgi:hypothetical protein